MSIQLQLIAASMIRLSSTMDSLSGIVKQIQYQFRDLLKGLGEFFYFIQASADLIGQYFTGEITTLKEFGEALRTLSSSMEVAAGNLMGARAISPPAGASGAAGANLTAITQTSTTTSLGKGIMGGIAKQLNPKLLALTLAMKPISALIEGLIAPLEPIIDIFGAVGEIIGLLLIPLVMEVMNILMPFLPLLMEIVTALMPIIKLLLIPLTILGQVVQATMPPITAIITLLGSGIAVLDIVTSAVVGLSGFITGFVGLFFNAAATWLTDLATTISDWATGVVDNIIGFFTDLLEDIKEFFEEIDFLGIF